MSSKRRSYDTDEITLRKVFAKSFVNNTNIGALRVLTADGTGGTYWAQPSTLGLNPSFNQINTTAGNFTADLSYNIFTMSAQTGIGFTKGSGSNELNIFGKAFNQIDISGNNTVYGFTNGVVTPSVKLAGAGGITLLSDPDTNTIVFTAQGTQISSSLFSFSRVQVYSNASSITDNLSNTNSVILNAASPSSQLQYVGLSDILLSTNATRNIIFYSLRPNGPVISTINGNVANISTNYVRKVDFSTGIQTLSTSIITKGLSTFNLSTTNVFTSTINFNDIVNNSLNTLAVSSGILTLNGQGIVGTVDVNENDLISTVEGLGSAGYLSTLSTNMLSTGWLMAGNVELSSVNFHDTGNANLYNLVSCNASLYFNGVVIGGGTVINNSNFSTYIYQISSVSTLFASADFVNISTVENLYLSPEFFSTKYFSTGNLEVSSISFRDRTLNTTQYLTTNNGFLQFNTSTVALRTDLTSTVIGLGTAGYISSSQLVSSFQNFAVSTIRGLGTAGYISSPQLLSTVEGLGTAGYLSSPQLLSTVEGLGTAGYLSTPSLVSSIEALGSLGFVSTSGLVSSIEGLGTAGYVSTTGLVSTVEGLGLAGYISTQSLVSSIDSGLVSTVRGLGTAGYISSPTLISSVQNGLVSTVRGLGTAGYISSATLISSVEQALVSTVAGIGLGGVTKITAGTNITISPESGLGNVTINASGGGGGASFTAFSTVLISSVSTLVNPTIASMEYLGFSTFSVTSGMNTYYLSTGTEYSQMSSVQFKIDSFSSFIRSSANLYVGIQYNYVFSFWKGPNFINSFGQPNFNLNPYIKDSVGISTTLMLGNTPGQYIFEKFCPNFISNVSLSYTYYNGSLPSQPYDITASNSYTRHTMFEIPKTSFVNLYNSTFSLYHVLTYGRQSPGQFNQDIANLGFPNAQYSIISGYSGFSSPNVEVNIGSNNPITLYVTN